MFDKIINKIREGYHALTGKYFVSVCYVDGKSLEVLEQRYLLIADKPGDQPDFVEDPHKATVVDFIIGYQIVKALSAEMKDQMKVDSDPQMQIDLVNVTDAAFVDHVLKG